MPILQLLPFILLLLFSGCREQPASPEIADVPEDSETEQRELWQRPGVVVSAMGDLEEKVVADIGAGRGFLVPYVAPYADRMIAIEIDPSLVDYLRDTLRPAILPESQQPRLEVRLTQPHDSGLKENEVDVAVIVNTLLYIEGQEAYLANLNSKIKDGGRLVIVDWKGRETPYGPDLKQRIPRQKLETMLKNTGYTIKRSDEATLAYQYLIVADK
ncbi:MAG: class I SAM-dependent methyltransferase [Bacteroidota bacterium]